MVILIIDYADSGSETDPFSLHIDNADNNQDNVWPIALSKVKPIELPIKKKCKRRRFKSYFGKTYESENR